VRLLASLFAIGLTMRANLVVVGPLLPQMRVELGMPYAVGGLLVTLPVLCMGLVAIPASFVSDRFGAIPALTACAVVLAISCLARSLVPDATLLIALTLPIGVGIGLGGALLPVVARERAPDRPSAATGAYVTGYVLGSTIATVLAVPLATAAGSWRAPLAFFAIVTLVLGAAWWWGTRGGPPAARHGTRLPSLPWRRPVAWLLVGLFGLQSLLFFGLITWLPAVFIERGMDPAVAGALVGVFIGIGLPTTVLAAWLGERGVSRRALLVSAAALTLVALVGTIGLPELPLMWVVLAGIGLGILFPVALTLPLDVAADAHSLSGFVGVMLGAGYLLSATAPFTLGAVRDVAGGFTVSLGLLALIAGVVMLAAFLLSPQRLAFERARSEGAVPRPPAPA
jgi:CP family cyanate transporter-like MFS transporter